MKIDLALRNKIKVLKVGGKPATVGTEKERTAAHNHANALKIKIRTRRQLSGGGFEIHRVQ